MRTLIRVSFIESPQKSARKRSNSQNSLKREENRFFLRRRRRNGEDRQNSPFLPGNRQVAGVGEEKKPGSYLRKFQHSELPVEDGRKRILRQANFDSEARKPWPRSVRPNLTLHAHTNILTFNLLTSLITKLSSEQPTPGSSAGPRSRRNSLLFSVFLPALIYSSCRVRKGRRVRKERVAGRLCRPSKPSRVSLTRVGSRLLHLI